MESVRQSQCWKGNNMRITRLGLCVLGFSFAALFCGIGFCLGEGTSKTTVLIGARLIEFIDMMKARSAWYIPTIDLDESWYIFAEQPGWTKESFFQNALQPALRDELSNPIYLQRTLRSPRVSIAKKAVATNKENLKTLYD